MSYQNPIHRVKLGIIEPWPECQPEFSEWDPRSQGYPQCPRTQIEARSPLTTKVARVPSQISNATLVCAPTLLLPFLFVLGSTKGAQTEKM